MENIFITSSDLGKMRLLKTSGFNNGGRIYYHTDNILYKIFNDRYDFISEKERNIDFLCGRYIQYAKLPIRKIILDGKFYGYSESNFKYSTTFKTLTKMPYIDRLKVVKDIYIALREIHKLGIYLGDVHMDNLLYRERRPEGAIIDFESVRFKGDENKFMDYYFIREDVTSPPDGVDSFNTDNIKIAIASLSFIYGINLEIIAKQVGIGGLLLLLNSINIESKKNLTDVLTNFDGDITYFDEIIKMFSKQDFDENKKLLKEKKDKYFH